MAFLDEEKKKNVGKPVGESKPSSHKVTTTGAKRIGTIKSNPTPIASKKSVGGNNWYKGSVPTETETLAQIYRVARQDEAKGRELYGLYETAKSEGSFYNPYTQATTTKQNQTTFNNTQKAKQEWADLQNELSFWAKSSRNYSDEELVSRIDMSKYPTLAKMDIGKDRREPLELLEGVGYSKDALYGVIWAARNPDLSTGDTMLDAVQRELGRGAGYTRNDQTANRLNPMHDEYNPYAVGSTMDDLMLKYGTEAFDQDWLDADENRALLMNPDTSRDYGKIFNAEENTKSLEAEIAKLYEEESIYLGMSHITADEALAHMFEDKPALNKLETTLKSGQLIDTTRALNFDRRTFEADFRRKFEISKAQENAGSDPAAAEFLSAEEKAAQIDENGTVVNTDTIPKSKIAPKVDIYSMKPANLLMDGIEWLAGGLHEVVDWQEKNSKEEIAAYIEEQNYAAASDGAKANLAAQLEAHPELLTTDGAQKAALITMMLMYEAGELDNPEMAEQAKEIQSIVQASMSMEPDLNIPDVYDILDDLLGLNGELVNAAENEGIGFNTALMICWDLAMALGKDFADNLIGAALKGIGILTNSESITETGEKILYEDNAIIADYNRLIAEKGTPLEYLVVKFGSEAINMQQLGGIAGAIGKWGHIKWGDGMKLATKLYMATPFAAQSFGSEFEKADTEGYDYATSFMSGLAGFGTTLTLSQFDGILKNVEASGMPYIPEVVEALGTVPGSGFKAGHARWGQAYSMWLGNATKTVINEALQEPTEGAATTLLVDWAKGKDPFDRDWNQFARERVAEAAGSVFLSLGSAVSTMPAYARSVKVAESLMRKSNVTAEDVNAFLTAMQQDMQDPMVSAEARERALKIATETRTGELITEGAMPGTDTSALEKAQSAVNDAEKKKQAADDALAAANEKFKANPADESAKNEVLRLIGERNKAQQNVDEAVSNLASIQAETDAAIDTQLNMVREQAGAEVGARMTEAEAMKTERAAAEEVRQQNENVLAMQADDFVQTYFAGAPIEQQKQIRDRYMSYEGETKDATRAMVEFAGQISRKFGLSIKFTDSHGIFEGAYTGGNQIVLDKNATQGDVIKRVLVHEITHAAEASKKYEALADAVLEAYYGGNTDQSKADIDEKARQYAETTGQEGEMIARTELVADRLGEMLSSNQKAMDRLVAEKPDVATRIWRAIKEFIGKLTGVKNSELDKYIQLEKKLEKALSNRVYNDAASKFAFEGYTRDGMRVYSSNFPEGSTKETRSSRILQLIQDVWSKNPIELEIERNGQKETIIAQFDPYIPEDGVTPSDATKLAAGNRKGNASDRKTSQKLANDIPDIIRSSKYDHSKDETGGKNEAHTGVTVWHYFTNEIGFINDDGSYADYDISIDVKEKADGDYVYAFAARRKKGSERTEAPDLFSDPETLNAPVNGMTPVIANGIVANPNAKVNLLIPSDNGEPAAEIIRGGATKYSLSSWTVSEKETVRKNLVNDGYEPDRVDKWIDDVDGVAAIIAADKDRLDYKAADNQVMLKNNQEYVKTLDASTLCAKRLLYQGTFNEIQYAMPNTVLTSEDLLHLSDMMNQAGLETPCGVCYVESRRRHLGKFAQEWLDGYNGDYKPTLAEVTTTDGLEALRHSHPDTYQSFVRAMNSKGSANPKVVQLRTDYRGDIRKLKKGETEKITKIGGLRIQSFSDFETPHLIDMMQAVLDMSGKKLSAQAYTKVPNFAWVFGDTGIKINLSLLAEGNGLNEDGSLRFSSKEGMDIDEAMRLRERYSENVGTILVGVSEEHIRAAMADPRIDYIIPFHKSGWGQNELNLLPVLNSYDNFEDYQNERSITGYHKNGKPKYGKPEGGNFYPIDYWDYSKSGDENAATYLRMCEEDGRVPKFEQFLEKDSEGHWVAPSGYWKMLIDFKMYDNDGNGAPQKPVLPIFNMDEAVRVLNEYEGGADTLPVAYDIVDRFVAEKKASAPPGTRFSLPSNDILDQRIAQHRNQMLAAPNGMIPSDDGTQQNYGNGERQFAGQTIQNSVVVPDWIKREFLRPEELNYEVSTNREQVERGWQRIQQNGYEAERDRLLSLDRYSSDDTAEANLMMAMALREDTADPATFMALASHYNKEGTKAGQELQARKLFTRMSPTGARVWAAGQMETRLEEHMRTHQNQRRKIDENASRIADQIRDMQGGDEVLRLNAGGDFTIDESNNRWGIPINEQQQALIDHYKLNNVTRPGIFYNRATTKQRMLEAILATPNPLEVTGLGLNLVQRLEYMNDGEAVITNADLNYIGTQLGQFVAQGGDEGGREADLAVSRAYEAYGNITPSTTREKLRTWRYVSMLLSVPSAIRNVIGNASQNVVNATAHGIAVELDKALSNITGKRTVEHLSYQERIDGWRGFVDETQNTFRDYFIDRSVTQRGNAKYNTNQRGRVYQNGFLETMRNMEGFLMSFGDRNIWRKAYLNSMAEQQKLADRGLLFNDDGTTRTHEQMLEQAEADANYATFTEDSSVSDVLSQLKNIPGLGEVVDFIMPFTGVPTNITRRMIQYSPVGLVEIALRHGYRAATGQNFNQRAFVDSLSRVLTGTGLFGVGMMLAAAGIIKPGTGDEDDDKKYGLKTAMGEQYTPFVYNPLNGEYVSLAAFAPAASPLTMGLAAYYEFKENDDWLQALINACFSGADQIFDASYMSGIQDIFKGYGSPAENITNAVFSNAVSQSVPALMTQLANTIDPYVRDTKDKNALMQALKSGLINKIPGLREALLPVKVDVTGQPVRTKEGAWNFIDPFTTTDAREDPAVEEQLRLSDALGSSSMLPSDALSGSKTTLTVNKQKVTLDDAGKETYRRRYGELWLEGGITIDKKGKPVKVEGVRNLIASPAYHLMDDEKRAKAIAAILSDAKTGASMEALNKYGAD